VAMGGIGSISGRVMGRGCHHAALTGGGGGSDAAVTPPRKTARTLDRHRSFIRTRKKKGTTVALPSTPNRPHGEFAMRYTARLNRGARLRLHTRREDLFAALARVDDELQTLVEERDRITRELVPRPSPAERRPATAATVQRRPSPPRRPPASFGLPRPLPPPRTAPSRPTARPAPPPRVRRRQRPTRQSPRRRHGLRAAKRPPAASCPRCLRAGTRLPHPSRSPRKRPARRPRRPARRPRRPERGPVRVGGLPRRSGAGRRSRELVSGTGARCL
jgi:hypothetical protein